MFKGVVHLHPAARPMLRSLPLHAKPANKPDDQEPASGPPKWKQYQYKKALGRQAEATLESVWARTEWPSDDTISSMWDLHKVRRELVIEWFKQKRIQSRGGSSSRGKRPSSSSSGGGGSSSRAQASSGTGGVDWNAEWNVGSENGSE